ncbi:hypothetical protein J3Q64DRAFT_1734052 [Phycomyces blakesleeanus]|uniref:Swiss Army Knife 2H phosphoesterase domain-containing protein n=2 Tax=Phycomyces blakesleeanus TaxID=4837 RepID=A0A162TLR0_PHYB8|nr:hypothetical protein PHYBLDRAFT_182770 [Phycomyces blakesleeanus NRRL 1555(-)]OAD69532.1 hypothetical protein PHYBLDRAFT_182770 [Phycomyces blakesleeanus NRRL 1555(-)]|eukprot:XP_018287572.1 hypothetical protein PHYBLDRAFT_182770 [Phycomyces blakesleeanus NRRL 1555(-)]
MKFILPLVGTLLCSMTCTASSIFTKTYKSPLGVPLEGPPIYISKKIHDTKSIEFVEHSSYPPWLGLELDYAYVKPIVDAINSTETPLLTRGESHITIVTPPEFDTLAVAGVTIEEINAIAREQRIQESKFDIVCLGKAELVQDGKNYIVYQIIVESPSLVKLREKIFTLYYSKGGNTALFDPRTFWSHITVAYTISDLFVDQGIYKSANVCHRPLIAH